ANNAGEQTAPSPPHQRARSAGPRGAFSLNGETRRAGRQTVDPRRAPKADRKSHSRNKIPYYASAMDQIRARIRDIPDFPKKGIIFKDITPVLSDPALFKQVIDALAQRWKSERISKVAAIESRGFIFGAPLACAIGAGFTIVRKPGKLPYQTMREAYALEYGE